MKRMVLAGKKRKVLLNRLTFCHSADIISADTYCVRKVGAPTQPSTAPWPGAEDSSAASPQPTPPSVIFHLIPLDSPPPRRLSTRGRDKGSRDLASRDSASRSSSAQRPPASEKAWEMQKGSLEHAQALTSSCKFPLPAACGRTPGLAPAPRRSCSD